MNLGKESIYIDHAFGHGLVPPTYEAYRKQRFRWAYGGMRIVRGHLKKLLGLEGQLTKAQRYHFIKGWLPWVGDALHMLFSVLALGWSMKLILYPIHTDFPAQVFVYPALALVLLRLVGTALTYSKRVRIGRERTLLAMVAGGSLTHTIAKAVVQGLFVPGSRPFYRTQKTGGRHALLKSLLTSIEEIIFATALIACAIGTIIVHGLVNDDAVIWAIALVTQSFPYVAAILASVFGSVAESKNSAAKDPGSGVPAIAQLQVVPQ